MTLFHRSVTLALAVIISAVPINSKSFDLKRKVAQKPVYTSLPQKGNTNEIVIKLREGTVRPSLATRRFVPSGGEWDKLNNILSTNDRVTSLTRSSIVSSSTLDQMRAEGSRRSGLNLPDMNLYHRISLAATTTSNEKLELIKQLNESDLVEIAYFSPEVTVAMLTTPNWEANENYLDAAPTGIDARYGWSYMGGRGEGIKVIDIEGNWVEHHEDLRGGVESFHIAGVKIADPTWYNHGTAVLGEIAADSNSFGTTGIAFEVDLGTVSIGSMSTASAISIAVTNSSVGDIILIELQNSGPNNDEYVPVEYYQAAFDAILTATSLGRIVVEAGANGSQNLDDAYWYGSLFDPNFRHSGALLIAAGNASHVPEWFTSYGQRLDVHGFGSGVYTLGYGGLWGTDTTTFYTATFGGTSSASPIIVGACAQLQGIYKNLYGTVMDHNEMRDLLQQYSTPQAPSSKNIGPMPDLRGSIDAIVGVAFTTDTTFGWVPFDVAFTGMSGLAVDTWNWTFGDGSSSSEQSPVHSYTEPGMHDVSLQIDAQGELRTLDRPNHIIALADSVVALDALGDPGAVVAMPLYARNTVPIVSMEIPIDITGPGGIKLDSFSTVGLRTDYFEEKDFIHYDDGNTRYTVKLVSSYSGTSPSLTPDTGAILNLYFRLPPQETLTPHDTVRVDAYGSRVIAFSGENMDYTPRTQSGLVGKCIEPGSVDRSDGIEITDLTIVIDYMFGGGILLVPEYRADYDCSGGFDILDITGIIDYLFGPGIRPCSCL